MENLILFLKIIAWIVGIFGTIIGVVVFYSSHIYQKSLEKIIDESRGIIKTYNSFKFLIPAMISWAFIIAFS